MRKLLIYKLYFSVYSRNIIISCKNIYMPFNKESNKYVNLFFLLIKICDEF